MNLDIGKLPYGRRNKAIFWFLVTKNENKNVLPLTKKIMLTLFSLSIDCETLKKIVVSR